MSYELVIRRQAKADLRRSARWYERQLFGLGRDFVAEVDAVVDRIVENPLQYQIIYRDIRRAQTHRFPYGLFYRIDGDTVILFAIVHLHRNQSIWKDRA